MTSVLRVLLASPPEAERVDVWALFDASGRVVQHGEDSPQRWPASDRREAVIAAEASRIVALMLPPLPRERQSAAVAYALEDRLATSAAESAVAVTPQDKAGRIIAIVTARELVAALSGGALGFDRVIAEPELALVDAGWRWCESNSSAFVRTDSGDAFPVSRAAGERLPTELALALTQASRNDRTPAKITVEHAADAAALARWQQETGVAFVAGIPWRWENAKPAAFAGATDLRSALRPAAALRDTKAPRRFAFAAVLLALALGLHALAALATWAWQHVALAREQQALVAIAEQAGAKADTSNAAATLATLHAAARHRAGLAADDDAMRILARAAPALAALPASALRTATWTGGAWTLELAPLDDAVLAGLVQRGAAAGLAVLHARTANGVRARLARSS